MTAWSSTTMMVVFAFIPLHLPVIVCYQNGANRTRDPLENFKHLSFNVIGSYIILLYSISEKRENHNSLREVVEIQDEKCYTILI